MSAKPYPAPQGTRRHRRRWLTVLAIIGPMLFVIFGLIVPALLGPAIGNIYSNIVNAL